MYSIPNIYTALEPIVCWSGGFTEADINEIIRIGDNLEFQEAKVGRTDADGQLVKSIRTSSLSWIKPSPDNAWLFKRMVEIVSRINTDKYQFDLSHIDAFQYTTYTEGGFYGWHIDQHGDETYGPQHRKLGFSVILSEPEVDFTGGEFQIIPCGNPAEVNSTKVKKGDIIAFPAFIPHQVTEVTSGKRKSLVCWVLGPKFK